MSGSNSPTFFFAGMTTAAFFALGISAYHLVKKSGTHEVWRRSFLMAAIFALIGSVLVGLVGHSQGQHMFKTQPMKMAAAEALWETEQPADLSLFTISDETKRKEIFSIKLPAMMSLLNCNNLTCEIRGINDIQAEYEQTYGPGDYIPPVTLVFWAFRVMVGAGLLDDRAGSGCVIPGAQEMARSIPVALAPADLEHSPALSWPIRRDGYWPKWAGSPGSCLA